MHKSFMAWANAWQAAMAEVGYPNAQLAPTIEPDGSITYHWNGDVNEMLESLVDQREQRYDKEAWTAAHTALIAVDTLRPDYVSRSIALQELIDVAQET